MPINKLSLGTLAIAAMACSSGGRPAGQPAPVANGVILTPADAPVNRNRDLITQEELQGSNIVGLSVLEAVKTLRPQFLTERGKNTAPAKLNNDPNGPPLNDGESGKVHVSIDGNKIALLDELSTIRASTVKEVRFLNIAQAHQKFGGAAREGPVILVTTM